MELTMFQRLQELPLLQGLSTDELNEIVTKVRLDFQQQEKGETIASQMSSCKQLVFVLKGTMRVEFVDSKKQFRFCEYLEAPLIIEPYSLFGLNQKYRRTYTCQTDCQTLAISRSQFLGIMLDHHIVKTNTLNLICNELQHLASKLEGVSHADIYTKFRQLVLNRSLYPRGSKQIFATMDTLADMLDETRLNVSRLLKSLNQQGLLIQERKFFTIPDVSKLPVHTP